MFNHKILKLAVQRPPTCLPACLQLHNTPSVVLDYMRLLTNLVRVGLLMEDLPRKEPAKVRGHIQSSVRICPGVPFLLNTADIC